MPDRANRHALAGSANKAINFYASLTPDIRLPNLPLPVPELTIPRDMFRC